MLAGPLDHPRWQRKHGSEPIPNRQLPSLFEHGGEPMELLWRHPSYLTLLHEQSLIRFDDFLKLSQGVVVRRRQNGSRSVTRLRLGPLTAYLKREFRIAVKEKFRNWWDGFGPVGKSLREWRMLRRAQAAGFLVPTVLACGQRGSQGFLLTAELQDCVPLDKYAIGASHEEWCSVLRRLASWLAKFHGTGLAHPDLYAWHIYVRLTDQEIGVLDLARSWRDKFIPWPERIRELAKLASTLPEERFTEQDLQNFILNYAGNPDNGLPERSCSVCSFAWHAVQRRVEHFRQTTLHKRRWQDSGQDQAFTNSSGASHDEEPMLFT